MAPRLSLCLALLPALTAAYRLHSYLRLDLRQTVTCSYAVEASNGDTCDSVASSWGLTVANFEALNPGVNCPTLVVGQEYCVLGTVSVSTTMSSGSTVSSTSTKPSTSNKSSTSTKSSTSAKSSTSKTQPPTATSSKATSTSTTSSFPYEPTQSGLAANCDNFYYVNTGDTCATIVAKYGITLTEFYSWNPAVGSQCTSMWAQYWVCVGVPGVKTTAATPTPTPTGPQPQMPGIVSNCNKFYMVRSGDSCYTIELAQGVTLAQLLSWNTQVNSLCTNLWLGYYICIGVS